MLAVARAARATEQRAATELLMAAVEWASMHEPVDSGDAAAWWLGGEMVPLAGDGAPLIAEYAVAELAAAVGMSTDAGRRLIGQGLELAHRLPRLWAQTVAGRLPAWRARRVAEHTMGLSAEAAAFVDTHLAAVAGTVSVAQLDRLLTEARRRFHGEATGLDEHHTPDRRHVRVEADQVSFDGTVRIDAEVDLGDALDLERALALTAGQLKELGSSESLDARRATALGELARNQLVLDFSQTGQEPAGAPGRARARRPVTLYLHLSEEALSQAAGQVGRCGNTRTPVDPARIRAWCGHPDAQVTVKPVLDLAGHVATEAYEVPDRLAEQVELRDATCVFPWCTRPARGCDKDHVIAYGRDGTTCSCNLAPVCRHHHRLKTHTPWRYLMPEPGVYVWTSPHGYVFLRDHTGTVDVTPAGLIPIPGCRAAGGP
ncbi:MAG TPA: HNH endonuclease [Nocardioides sp.]|uniref:HNH endonuclease signature motif containing protein n=1 Tax=Nocardioides sp. TaxID=35761 RepID=UPI002BA005C5|nr:HNH endonuclease [Nocardioides sp.]HQR28205.1 HNH endonuclease [Nocardioides sp.]